MALDKLGQTPWVEIMPPPAPPMDTLGLLLWAAVAVLLLAGAAWGGRRLYLRTEWRRRRRLHTLTRRLRQRSITAREALHVAAATLPAHALAEEELHALNRRFAREEPELESALLLLVRLAEGRR